MTLLWLLHKIEGAPSWARMATDLVKSDGTVLMTVRMILHH